MSRGNNIVKTLNDLRFILNKAVCYQTLDRAIQKALKLDKNVVRKGFCQELSIALSHKDCEGSFDTELVKKEIERLENIYNKKYLSW